VNEIFTFKVRLLFRQAMRCHCIPRFDRNKPDIYEPATGTADPAANRAPDDAGSGTPRTFLKVASDGRGGYCHCSVIVFVLLPVKLLCDPDRLAVFLQKACLDVPRSIGLSTDGTDSREVCDGIFNNGRRFAVRKAIFVFAHMRRTANHL
jgi:hypothetical protein